MSVQQTARQRVRAAMVNEIKDAARAQVAAGGAASLSLRAVARELGMVSSAIYRYFPSRDELLTALIIDSYDALGATVERVDAAAVKADHTGRWIEACRAIRGWAVANPHEYALLYGSPVPGYRAPQDTIPAATRVTAVLAGIVSDAAAAAQLAVPPRFDGEQLPPSLTQDARRLAEALMPGAPDDVVTRCLLAWIAVFGLVSFELFGHLNNVVHDYDEAFDHQVHELARYVGLPTAGS
jgi:AcrR family transcriptional regulator